MGVSSLMIDPPTSSTSFSDGLYYKNYKASILGNPNFIYQSMVKPMIIYDGYKKSCARNIIQNFFWNIIKVLIINRNHTHIYIYMEVSWNGGTQIIHFNGIFPYTPFISGFPHLWNTTVSLRHRLAWPGSWLACRCRSRLSKKSRASRAPWRWGKQSWRKNHGCLIVEHDLDRKKMNMLF